MLFRSKNKYDEKITKTEKISFIVESQSPRLAFNDRSYILLKDDVQHVPLTAINIVKVNLQIVRISDRSFIENLIRRHGAVNSDLYDYSLSKIRQETGEEIYKGSMEVPFEITALFFCSRMKLLSLPPR